MRSKGCSLDQSHADAPFRLDTFLAIQNGLKRLHGHKITNTATYLGRCGETDRLYLDRCHRELATAKNTATPVYIKCS